MRFLDHEFLPSLHPSKSYSLLKAYFKCHLLLEALQDAPYQKRQPSSVKVLGLDRPHFWKDHALPCSFFFFCLVLLCLNPLLTQEPLEAKA